MNRRSIGLTIAVGFLAIVFGVGLWAHHRGYNSHTWQAPANLEPVAEPLWKGYGTRG